MSAMRDKRSSLRRFATHILNRTLDCGELGSYSGNSMRLSIRGVGCEPIFEIKLRCLKSMQHIIFPSFFGTEQLEYITHFLKVE